MNGCVSFSRLFSFHKNDAIKRRAETIERETVELSDTVVSITGRVVDELRTLPRAT